MLANAGFRQVAPRYPEKISTYLPEGTRSAIERAAEREKISAPELVRRTLTERFSQTKKEA